MAEQIEQAPPPSSDFGQPLIGIPFSENGHEVIRYFIDETAADAAVREQAIQQAMSLAGSWGDLDWDEMEATLDRIRHESPPTPVLATWIIRSKTSPSKRRKICFPCLQTQESRCTIRSCHQHTRTPIFSRDGEASCMTRVLKHLQRLKNGCLDALSSRFTRWTKPLRTSLPLATLTDLGKSK